jgi:hypothetical protein
MRVTLGARPYDNSDNFGTVFRKGGHAGPIAAGAHDGLTLSGNGVRRRPNPEILGHLKCIPSGTLRCTDGVDSSRPRAINFLKRLST